MNFELMSVPQLENIVRTARDQRTRVAAEKELEMRNAVATATSSKGEECGTRNSAGTLPLFPTSALGSATGRIRRGEPLTSGEKR